MEVALMYSAVVLDKLEKQFNTLLSDKFDLICGTSTGGILALAIALKIPMSDAVEFYSNKGPLIFNENFKTNFPLGNVILRIKQAIGNGKYSERELLVSDKTFFTYKKRADSICKIQPF